MKYILLTASIMLATPAVADNAKACMGDYTQDNFHSYDFGKAAACMQRFRTIEQEQKVAELREFLKAKPHYKGPDWKWEQTADWRCSRQHPSGRTVCRKPFYTRTQ